MKKKKCLNRKIIFTITMIFVVCCFILTSLWADDCPSSLWTEYCESYGSSYHLYITRVVVSPDLDNTSLSSYPIGYSDFTHLTAHLTQGKTYSVSLENSMSWDPIYWKIWIDFNGDEDFDDEGENVFNDSGGHIVNGTIDVPGETLIGTTRMRVSLGTKETNLVPCGSIGYGEVEDYTVCILPPSCSSSGNSQAYEWIARVQVADLDNSSGPSPYTDFTYLTANLARDENVEVTLTPGYSGNSYTEYWRIWIDYNQDGDFTDSDPEEKVFEKSGVGAVTGNFTVEEGAPLGQMRMRISMKYGSYPDPCEEFIYGEVEDYGVNIKGIVGNTTVFGSTTTTAYRRAMPFTMPETGTIESVTMYHNGGSGKMILAVYDGASLPNTRLGVTAETLVNESEGWQTIDLTSCAFVSGGTTIWLAWVYESTPRIHYQTGSPGRAEPDENKTWPYRMPDPFGSSTQANYIYSIYATYIPD